MARTGAVKHVHKYYKNKLGLWACALGSCTHYLPTNVEDKINTSRSICWKCGHEFFLNPVLLERDHPECQVCLYPNFTSMDDFLRDRDLKIKEAANRIVVKVERDGKGNRLLYDDKGNVTIEKIETDSGLIIDGE